jgi:hypothetical protein
MDASLISQHVVHLITLTPTQQEAARVSGLANVTAFDASLIAQYLVCIPNASSAGTWTFDSYASTVGANDNHNFLGLLKGDVDGDWSATGAQSLQLAASALGMDATRVSLADVAAIQGSQVTVPVRLDNLKGRGVVAFEFDVVYDPTVLTTGQGAATLEGTLSNGLAVASNSPEPGLLKVVVYGALPLSGDGVYVKLSFAAIGESGSVSPLAISGFRLNDGKTQVLTQNGSVSINAATGPMFGGRVVTSTGAPIRNARVAITTTTGQTVFALSNAFGYVTVSGLTTGETYTLTTTARGFVFTPVSISASPGLTQVEIVAQP